MDEVRAAVVISDELWGWHTLRLKIRIYIYISEYQDHDRFHMGAQGQIFFTTPHGHDWSMRQVFDGFYTTWHRQSRTSGWTGLTSQMGTCWLSPHGDIGILVTCGAVGGCFLNRYSICWYHTIGMFQRMMTDEMWWNLVLWGASACHFLPMRITRCLHSDSEENWIHRLFVRNEHAYIMVWLHNHTLEWNTSHYYRFFSHQNFHNLWGDNSIPLPWLLKGSSM